MKSFTQIEDVNELILLEMDIDSLSNYCQTNKLTHCNNRNFWRKKFKYDSLPFDYVNPSSTAVKDACPTAEWIYTYRLLYQAKKRY